MEGTWLCPVCHSANADSVENCSSCATPRQGHEPSLSAAGGGGGVGVVVGGRWASTPPGAAAWTPPPNYFVRTKLCYACRAVLDAGAEICPRCGTRQPYVGKAGKSRVAAAVLALLLGSFGLHKFYLGKTAQGVLYLLFFWTYIPALIAWIEGIGYLLRSDESWADEYGGPLERPGGCTMGCLWMIALVPIVALLSLLAVILLGQEINHDMSQVASPLP